MLLGLDVGTSSLKGVLCDRAGRVVASESAAYDVSRPRPGWSEQDPALWWRTAVEVVRRLSPGGVDAVGLSGQMHGLVLVDGAGLGQGGGEVRALRPAILWNDQRTAAECAFIESEVGGRAELVRLVGNAALTGFTLPKILWVRRHEAGTLARAAGFMLPKDYLGLCLTGEAATDVGDAAGTLLFDIDRRAWSAPMLERFGLDPALCPRAFESAAVVGGVGARAAAAMGLREGTIVVAGSGDNQAGAVGAGVVEEGRIVVTLGTSGVVYAHADSPRRDLGDPLAPGRLHTMCAADGSGRRAGHWSVTGCMLSAGGSLAWARALLAPGVAYAELLAEAWRVPPGSRGLVFLPHLTGERCPYPDPSARGAWIGLTARHGRAEMIRAVVEGITVTIGQIRRLMGAAGVPIERARIGGGGARSREWRQMMADELGVPVALPQTEEGPAFGAALLAGVGLGDWPGVAAACSAAIQDRELLEPGENGALGPVRAVYDRAYERIRDEMHALAAIDS